MERKWKLARGYRPPGSTRLVLKLLHWNILAQNLCRDQAKVKDDAPILNIDNRLRLMREHFEAMDADIIGIAEMDAMGNADFSDCLFKMQKMMRELGYSS